MLYITICDVCKLGNQMEECIYWKIYYLEIYICWSISTFPTKTVRVYEIGNIWDDYNMFICGGIRVEIKTPIFQNPLMEETMS